jgi:hypothetical protein
MAGTMTSAMTLMMALMMIFMVGSFLVFGARKVRAAARRAAGGPRGEAAGPTRWGEA